MNAIWITRISKYKQTENCLASAEVIMNLKNQRREFIMFKKYNSLLPHIRLINNFTAQGIMLAEGRAAQLFWKKFSLVLPVWCNFLSRKAKSDDITNRLLDIGYHHITNIVKKILDKYDISSVLGILHIARISKSAPLVYDLVEMFRADIVETEVLKFLRMKKIPINILFQKDIPVFLHTLNYETLSQDFSPNFEIKI